MECFAYHEFEALGANQDIGKTGSFKEAESEATFCDWKDCDGFICLKNGVQKKNFIENKSPNGQEFDLCFLDSNEKQQAKAEKLWHFAFWEPALFTLLGSYSCATIRITHPH